MQRGHYVKESTKGAAACCFLEVCIWKDDGACFPAEFHQARLEILARGGGDYLSNCGASSKIDLPYGGMLNE